MADHFRGKTAFPHKGDDRLPVQRKGRGSVWPQTIEVFAEMIAFPSPALPARFALAAPIVGRNHVITCRESFDIRSDAFNDSARFMSQHHRVRVVLLNPDVRVADPTSDSFYQNFVGTGLLKVKLPYGEFRSFSTMHRG
jgi:hypothetical protein